MPEAEDDSDLSEEKFAADLIGQIEQKVTRKLRKAGIAGVSVKVNRTDYSLDFSGAEDAVERARKFLADEQEAKTRDLDPLDEE